MVGSDDGDPFVELNDVFTAENATYGKPVAFAEGHAMRFPDFELMYRGRIASPVTGYQDWVFRLRDGASDREITMSSGGALSEPGVSWTTNGQTFSMDWIRRKGRPLTQIVVNPLHE